MAAIITCIISVIIIGLTIVFPVLEGEPMTAQARVKGRKFVPKHQNFAGNVLIGVPDTWTLEVENENGTGLVKVSQQFYEGTASGDLITVVGTKGRLTKKWYLKEALKEI
ncbi:hypothetical protein EON83_06685 [bacterium]|nr:MAG: hypothetical protein EON83_06685 [bacterium]